MEEIHFEIRRFPCIPNPRDRKAKAAKLLILSQGGSFFRFSIDGYSNVTDLLKYLQDKFSLGEGTILDAIDGMAEVFSPEMGVRVKDVWGLSEVIDGLETITFTGFAFTQDELLKKSELFISSVKSLKDFLTSAIASAEKGMLDIESWKI